MQKSNRFIAPAAHPSVMRTYTAMRDSPARIGILLLAFLLDFCLVHPLASAPSQQGEPQPRPPFELTIRPSKSTFHKNEPIAISVSIRNPGPQPIDVAFLYKDDHPIIRFHVEGPQMGKIPLSTKSAPWCGTGVQNESIAPGRQIKFTADLRQTWEYGGAKPIFAPGTYKVLAEVYATTTNGGSITVAQSRTRTFRIISKK